MDNNIESLINLYPNPIYNFLYIETNNSYRGKYKIIIYDIVGKVVQNYNGSKLSQVEMTSFDLSNIKTGLYFISFLFGDNKTIVRKLIKI